MDTPILFKIVLFSSSYIPLIWIIIIQLIQNSLNISNYTFQPLNVSAWVNLLNVPYILPIFILNIFWLAIMWALYKCIHLHCNSNDFIPVVTSDVTNINSSYITNYLSVYIFPFITLNMTKLDGIFTFSILTCIVAYVYIKNDILYINPILNIFFKYNIYTINVASISSPSKKEEIILLSQQTKVSLKQCEDLTIQCIGGNVFIDRS